MLTYKSSYKWSDAIVLGAVLDFPGTIAYGNSLDDARRNLASALRDMADTNLLKGNHCRFPIQRRPMRMPTWRSRFTWRSKPANKSR
jgi:predicted RNase H-like HicB family nuclease